MPQRRITYTNQGAEPHSITVGCAVYEITLVNRTNEPIWVTLIGIPSPGIALPKGGHYVYTLDTRDMEGVYRGSWARAASLCPTCGAEISTDRQREQYTETGGGSAGTGVMRLTDYRPDGDPIVIIDPSEAA